MRIVAIFDYYAPHIGGAEVVYQHVLEGLVSKGHEVSLVTLQSDGAKTTETLNGVNITRVSSPLGRMFFPFFGFWKAFKTIGNADVLLTSFYSSSVLTFSLKLIAGKKVVMIVHEVLNKRWHNLGFSWLRSAFLRLSERIALPPSYDAYIAVSNSTAKHLKELVPEKKVHRIYNGVDHELFAPHPRNEQLRQQLQVLPEEKVYMYAGRPGYAKGIDVLLSAIPKVLETHKDVVFILMLSPSPEEKYKAIVKYVDSLEDPSRVRIIAPVDRNVVVEYFAMADVAVVPSLTEGFGFLAAEFSSMNIPIVASRVDSLPEVISGKVAYAMSGSVESLVLAILQAYEGQFVLEPDKVFSWEHAINSYEEVLSPTISYE